MRLRAAGLAAALVACGVDNVTEINIDKSSVEVRQFESFRLDVRLIAKNPTRLQFDVPAFLTLDKITEGGSVELPNPGSTPFLAQPLNDRGGLDVEFTCNRVDSGRFYVRTIVEEPLEPDEAFVVVRCRELAAAPQVEAFVAELFRGTPLGEGFEAGESAGYAVNYVRLDAATQDRHGAHTDDCVVFSEVEQFTSDPSPPVQFTTPSADIRMEIVDGLPAYTGLPTESPFIGGRAATVVLDPDADTLVQIVSEAPSINGLQVVSWDDVSVVVQVPPDERIDMVRLVGSRVLASGIEGIDCRVRPEDELIVIDLGERPVSLSEEPVPFDVLVGALSDDTLANESFELPVHTGAMLSIPGVRLWGDEGAP